MLGLWWDGGHHSIESKFNHDIYKIKCGQSVDIVNCKRKAPAPLIVAPCPQLERGQQTWGQFGKAVEADTAA